MGPPWVLFGGGQWIPKGHRWVLRGGNGFPRANPRSSRGPMGPQGPWVQIGSPNRRKTDPGSLQVEHEPRGVHEPMRCISLGGA